VLYKVVITYHEGNLSTPPPGVVFLWVKRRVPDVACPIPPISASRLLVPALGKLIVSIFAYRGYYILWVAYSLPSQNQALNL
jgi:hypothetical protein